MRKLTKDSDNLTCEFHTTFKNYYRMKNNKYFLKTDLFLDG